MTHLPFIAASYALGVLVPLVFVTTAFTRMAAARRRLAAIDPRVNRPGAGPQVNRAQRQQQEERNP
jgi:cytochrome c biogenesis protein CcdA